MNILLIDDDSDDREIFCEALEALSADIVCSTAADGKKALAKMDDKEIDLPNLIFLDINMPVIDGWKCLSMLKGNEHYQQIPVVMYSTSSYPEDILKAQDMGAFCFFSKPSSYKELKTSLDLFINSVIEGNAETLSHNNARFSIFQPR